MVGNRLLDPEQRSVQARMERSNTLTSGHRACQGCGEALGARYALDAAMRATDGRLIAANATGCLEVFSTPFPESSWQLPWIHSLFGNAPAVATGVAAALKAKGRDDVRVVGQGGDGGTVDIGFACLSGMFERNDDVLYICYDNEAYMNTGVQRSGRDAAGGPDREHEAGRRGARQRLRPGQERAADRDGARDPLRRHRDRRRAARPRAQGRAGDGVPRRPLHPRLRALPARLGPASRDTIRLARLVKETGLFPVFEAERRRGRGRLEDPPPVPVEEYLKLQRRYAHLFGDPPRDRRDRADPGDRRPQHPAASACSPPPRRRRPAGRGDRRRRRLPARPAPADADGGEQPDAAARRDPHGAAVMEKPFAITLDVGSSLANKTGSWRTERAVYVDRLPPCNDACPAGENIQAWLYEAEEGDEGYERAWRKLIEDNPFPAIMGRVCYHPCETACNRGQLDEAVGINSVERFLGDEAIKQRLDASRPAPSAPASGCWWSAPGPRGSRPPTT